MTSSVEGTPEEQPRPGAFAPVTGSVWPADGDLEQVAQHMQQCGEAWEPGARLIGNCRACDIAAIAADYLRLREKIEYVRSLGEVYKYPEDWRCSKMGGSPDIAAYEKLDLSDV